MKLERRSLLEVQADTKPVIGFWGMPPVDALEAAAKEFPDLRFFDLDVFHEAPATRILPDAYCHIIRNCVDNAVALGTRLACVVAATGPEKCDAGRYAGRLVEEKIGIKVMHTENRSAKNNAAPLLCESEGPLKKRIIRIMESIIEPLTDAESAAAASRYCPPTHGFWGTPPHPISVLDLFPDTTHVFGWTRAVEIGRPADLDLEMSVPEGLPVVFFVQGFCAKAMLGRSLAERHRGMFVDVHDTLNAATRAKIEAFVRLSGR